jgi:hypothetical protein
LRFASILITAFNQNIPAEPTTQLCASKVASDQKQVSDEGMGSN